MPGRRRRRRFSLICATNSLATDEIDVGFEQRDANFAQYLVDVRLGETAAIRQPRRRSRLSAR